MSTSLSELGLYTEQGGDTESAYDFEQDASEMDDANSEYMLNTSARPTQIPDADAMMFDQGDVDTMPYVEPEMQVMRPPPRRYSGPIATDESHRRGKRQHAASGGLSGLWAWLSGFKRYISLIDLLTIMATVFSEPYIATGVKLLPGGYGTGWWGLAVRFIAAIAIVLLVHVLFEG